MIAKKLLKAKAMEEIIVTAIVEIEENIEDFLKKTEKILEITLRHSKKSNQAPNQ